MIARGNPWASAPVVGEVAAASKYYGVPLVLWVEEVSRSGRWGLVELPFVSPRREGWIPLEGLDLAGTRIRVDVDLSEHLVRVFDSTRLLVKAPGATGAASSPTPTGDYVVTDRVRLSSGGAFGSFAFGLSGIQPNLPRGWSGGNQLAIHGTDDPGSIGQSVSAGCVRVSETTLDRLLPLLRLGTPVEIHP
jgi:lipoprotein-anchoring transpeptidase ErfK/SrfK